MGHLNVATRVMCKSTKCLVVSQVAEEIWVCEKGTVTKWQGDILQYKEHLKSKILKENAKRK